MAKKKAAKKKPAANKHSKPRRIPRQEVIPGIGDQKIAAIENAALDYAEIRDERQELTAKEVKLKERLMDLMHNKGLKEYKRGGISVKLVPEGENVKVRVRAEEDLDEAAPAETVEVPEQSEESEAQPD